MTQTIEETVKTLTEFESVLDIAKVEASDAKRLLVKSAAAWAANARGQALARARSMAEDKLAAAKQEAEKDAEAIRASGQASLVAFQDRISRGKEEAVELVVRRLVGSRQ